MHNDQNLIMPPAGSSQWIYYSRNYRSISNVVNFLIMTKMAPRFVKSFLIVFVLSLIAPTGVYAQYIAEPVGVNLLEYVCSIADLLSILSFIGGVVLLIMSVIGLFRLKAKDKDIKRLRLARVSVVSIWGAIIFAIVMTYIAGSYHLILTVPALGGLLVLFSILHILTIKFEGLEPKKVSRIKRRYTIGSICIMLSILIILFFHVFILGGCSSGMY